MEHWNWRQRSIAEIVWPSFLAACVATLVCFANVDPARLLDALVFPLQLSNTAVYSIGFFFFWAVCALASGLTTWLIRTERRRAQFPDLPDED